MPDPSARHLPSPPAAADDSEASSQRPLFANRLTLAIVDSTNRYLVDAARDGAPEGTVVVADEQTSGRGRRGRRWLAPPGSSLLCSILFRPELELEDLHLVPTLVGLAARQAIEAASGVAADLKWPNDILVGTLKVGGMLSEVVAPRTERWPASETGLAVIVGIGINLAWPDGFPGETDDPESAAIAATATTLESVSTQRVDRDELLGMMVGYLDADYPLLGHPSGRRQVMDRYRRACSTPGQRVTIAEANGSFDADAVAITDEGRLLVMVDGHPQAVDAADVIHIRPVGANWRDVPRGPHDLPPTTLTGP